MKRVTFADLGGREGGVPDQAGADTAGGLTAQPTSDEQDERTSLLPDARPAETSSATTRSC